MPKSTNLLILSSDIWPYQFDCRDLNIFQSIWNMTINIQKHILDLNKRLHGSLYKYHEPVSLTIILVFWQKHQNMPYGIHKYRFGLQKGVKNQKYFFIFEKYNVSALQRTFDRLHILKPREVTSGWIFVIPAPYGAIDLT